MSLFSKLFKKEEAAPAHPLVRPLVDMHSHLLPGIDDGVDSFEESVDIIKGLMNLGYKKFITTPHVMSDFYRNTPEEIRALCAELNSILQKQGIDVEVEAAAEYYLDDHFEDQLKKKNLLSFGNNYVLVETSYLNPCENMFELIFNCRVAGYQPILAHPERYTYLYADFEKYKDIFARDVYFQLNLASLVGYYSKDSKRIAERLIKENMVHFVGTDVHHMRHLPHLTNAIKSENFHHLCQLNLMNNSLAEVIAG